MQKPNSVRGISQGFCKETLKNSSQAKLFKVNFRFFNMQRTFVWIVDIKIFFRVNFHTRWWNYQFTSRVWQVPTAAKILELYNLLKSDLRISTRAYGMSFFIGFWVLFYVALSVLKRYQLFLPVGQYSWMTFYI